MLADLKRLLTTSLRRQEALFANSLILNPVENIPSREWLKPASSFLHGLYCTDKLRDREQCFNAKIQFSGRRRIAVDTNVIYRHWCEMMGASNMSMRLLSGLHAHIVIFMALGNIGDKVLLLPEDAGGHMATKAILTRLGYEVIDIAVDHGNMSISVEETKKLIDRHKPDFLFIDRSEGLAYEDYSEIVAYARCYAIFDASQYLTNIMANDLKNPFDMGFDLVVSSIHKNYPGPQKGVVFSRAPDARWESILQAMSCYVSNFHISSVYIAGLSIADTGMLQEYSKHMLHNSVSLERQLIQRGVPAVARRNGVPPTHHIWIRCPERRQAFDYYSDLEFSRIMTNYRKLPYGLGYGLRLGTSAATFIGMRERHIGDLAECMADIWRNGRSLACKHKIRDLIKVIQE